MKQLDPELSSAKDEERKEKKRKREKERTSENESKKAPLVMKIPKDVLHQKKRKESKDKPRDERKEKKRPKVDYPPPPQRYARLEFFRPLFLTY